MPKNRQHYACRNDACLDKPTYVLDVAHGTASPSYKCPTCMKPLSKGMLVLADIRSKIEAFTKFGRGTDGGEFYQDQYLQMQIESGPKRKHSDGTSVFVPVGMEIEPDHVKKRRDAFSPKLKEGCCLALSSVWLQLNAEFGKFYERVLDTKDKGGMEEVRRIQTIYSFSVDGDLDNHIKYIAEKIFSEMKEFKQAGMFGTGAKYDRYNGKNATSSDNVAKAMEFASKAKGHYIFGIWGDGGHAMAIMNYGKKVSFFDPNSGQYDFPDMFGLTHFLRMYMAHVYPKMTADSVLLRFHRDEVLIKM